MAAGAAGGGPWGCAGYAMAAGAGVVLGMPGVDRALSDDAVFVLCAGDFSGGGFRGHARGVAAIRGGDWVCGGGGGKAAGGGGGAGGWDGRGKRWRGGPAFGGGRGGRGGRAGVPRRQARPLSAR